MKMFFVMNSISEPSDNNKFTHQNLFREPPALSFDGLQHVTKEIYANNYDPNYWIFPFHINLNTENIFLMNNLLERVLLNQIKNISYIIVLLQF